MPGSGASIEMFILLGLVAAAVWAAYATRLRSHISIHVAGDVVRISDKVPAAKAVVIRDFFLNDFVHRKQLAIRIWIRPNRTYHLKFSPRITPGEAQQIRNFLPIHL